MVKIRAVSLAFHKMLGPDKLSHSCVLLSHSNFRNNTMFCVEVLCSRKEKIKKLIFNAEVTFWKIFGREESEVQRNVHFTCMYLFSFFLFLFFPPRRMPCNAQLHFRHLSFEKENVACSLYHLQQG